VSGEIIPFPEMPPADISPAELQAFAEAADLAIHADASVVSLDFHRRAQLLVGAPCTDLGNGERFASRHGDRARYLPGDKSWYVWDGMKWKRDEHLQVKRFAKDTIRAMKDQALKITNKDEQTRILKHVHASESSGRIEAMLHCASSEPGLAITTEAFDREPMLLTCPNGTLDLSTRTLHPNTPGNLITRSTNTVYDDTALCPTWTKFLTEIFDHDQDLIGYMQRAIGYSLTADTREDLLHICWGTGSNGKSTWGNLIGSVMGDYAESASVDTFLADTIQRSSNAPKEDLARLRGARFVRATEPDERRPLNASLLKELTGREPITARFLFGSTFKFRPVFKLWISANHKPAIHDPSHGMWRRVRLIPFAVQFSDAQKDSTLEQRLLAESSGILNWALQGTQDWLAYGLQAPPSIAAATEQYRADSDLLGGFIRDLCTIDSWRSVSPDVHFRAYKEWCDQSGERAWPNHTFQRKLTDRGFPVDTATGKRQGIGLRDDYSPSGRLL
jgi:putative DNA primase/helicase